ncbi:hypothetical protein BTA51_18985 [Hahella sp. CCB-MM4]|nr:hypothetical protein BTA51_18985 [Hahella sp. CCB-MM4]
MPTGQQYPVLLRYDDEAECKRFVDQFGEDFAVTCCDSDQLALDFLIRQGQEICAVFVDLADARQALESPLFLLASQRFPHCLKVLLSDGIALDEVIELVGKQVVDKCFSRRYDRDLIRSLVYTAQMALHDAIGMPESQVSGEASFPTVLIVDDEQAATKYLRKQLERMQDRFNVLCAANADEALSIVRSQPVAVIMTDQRMPGMKGDQLLNELRRSQPHIIRILTSAYGEVDVALGAVNQGKIFRYQKKPWDAREVLACLDAALDEHRKLTQMHRDSRSYIKQEFSRICQTRRTALCEALADLVDGVGGEGTLRQFLEDMEKVVMLPPNTSHLRASGETDVEKLLVRGVQEELRRQLEPLARSDKTCWQQSLSSLAGSLKAYCGIMGEASIDPVADLDADNPVCVGFLNALELILSSSGMSREALVFEASAADWELRCGSAGPLKMYAHLLAPLTRVSSPLLQQQSALLMLYILCRRLGGTIELEGAQQSFSLKIRIPGSGG